MLNLQLDQMSAGVQVIANASPMKVLVIEDDRDVVELVSQCITLRWPQARVAGVGEGRRGLILAEGESPELVVLDIGLPDIHGFEVLKGIREFSDVPVIMLTGQDRDVDIAMFLNEGADDYIVKPFSQVELVARIEAVLRRARGPSRVAQPDQPAEDAEGAPAEAGPSQQDPESDVFTKLIEDQQLYDGEIRIHVQSEGNMRLVVSFVKQVRENSDLRMLRLANSPTGGVDIWLGMRQPIPLRKVLGEMQGVADVSPTPEHDALITRDIPRLAVTLAATTPPSPPPED